MVSKTMIAATIVLILMAACGPQPGPQVTHTDTLEPYPGPLATPTEGPNPYPGVDATDSSDNSAGGSPYPSPLEPIPGEEAMERGELVIESTDLLIAESYPPQFTLIVKGSLPTPCHVVRATMSPPDEQNRIRIELYSLSDPEKMCAQVITPFETHIPLGSFPDGAYTIWLNGKQVKEFTTP